MPPCSPVLQAKHLNKTVEESNSSDLILPKEQTFQTSEVGPLCPCNKSESRNLRNKLTKNLMMHTEVSPSAVLCAQQPSNQCINLGHIIGICKNETEVVLRCCCNNKSQFLIHNSPRRINSWHRADRNAFNAPGNVRDNEHQNDSGFGSEGFQPTFDTGDDLEKLEKNEKELLQCCFYYSSINSQMSRSLLRNKPTGTFLIRDSSDSRYLYSLSVKTEKGATSVRILYYNGRFQFDSDERVRNRLPQFDSVLALVDFYVKVTWAGDNKSWRWEETAGGKSLAMTLTKPLRNSVPSLAHLARVKINECLDSEYLPELSIDRLLLDSDELKDFIKEYPYRV